MTINELHIQLDLQPENRIDILEDVATNCNKGYLFVDSLDGHCYLFDRNGNEDDIKKLKKINNSLFYYSNIESIAIPDSVKSIGNDAFVCCKNLKSAIIPNSIKNIGDYAFAHCENLKSIEIPDSVKNIRYLTFGYCENLKSVVIPNSIESIGNYSFAYCENLESIIIPNSVESIGKRVFKWCKNLKSLTFKGKTIYQIKAMNYYPFGIEDESIIRCI